MDSVSPVSRHRSLLVLMMRAIGILTLFAFFAVVMPHSWMDWFHQRMGMGSLPDLPMISYLARSLSGFYVWFAVLILYVIRDVDRYLPFIRFFSITGFLLGIGLIGIDWWSELPWWWTVSEGVFLLTFFGITWWLCNRVAEEASDG